MTFHSYSLSEWYLSTLNISVDGFHSATTQWRTFLKLENFCKSLSSENSIFQKPKYDVSADQYHHHVSDVGVVRVVGGLKVS